MCSNQWKPMRSFIWLTFFVFCVGALASCGGGGGGGSSSSSPVPSADGGQEGSSGGNDTSGDSGDASDEGTDTGEGTEDGDPVGDDDTGDDGTEASPPDDEETPAEVEPGDDVAEDPEPPTPVIGKFVDAPVEGLDYRTPTREGTTDQTGTFEFLPGEDVTFYLGTIKAGSAAGKAVVTPEDFFPYRPQDQELVMRVLQTLDQDGNPENGILLTNASKVALENYFNVQDDDEIALVDLAEDPTFEAAGAAVTGGRPWVSREDARAHYETSIAPHINDGSYSRPSDEVPPEDIAVYALATGRQDVPFLIFRPSGELMVPIYEDGAFAGLLAIDHDGTIVTARVGSTGGVEVLGNEDFVLAVGDDASAVAYLVDDEGHLEIEPSSVTSASATGTTLQKRVSIGGGLVGTQAFDSTVTCLQMGSGLESTADCLKYLAFDVGGLIYVYADACATRNCGVSRREMLNRLGAWLVSAGISATDELDWIQESRLDDAMSIGYNLFHCVRGDVLSCVENVVASSLATWDATGLAAELLLDENVCWAAGIGWASCVDFMPLLNDQTLTVDYGQSVGIVLDYENLPALDGRIAQPSFMLEIVSPPMFGEVSVEPAGVSAGLDLPSMFYTAPESGSNGTTDTIRVRLVGSLSSEAGLFSPNRLPAAEAFINIQLQSPRTHWVFTYTIEDCYTPDRVGVLNGCYYAFIQPRYASGSIRFDTTTNEVRRDFNWNGPLCQSFERDITPEAGEEFQLSWAYHGFANPPDPEASTTTATFRFTERNGDTIRGEFEAMLPYGVREDGYPASRTDGRAEGTFVGQSVGYEFTPCTDSYDDWDRWRQQCERTPDHPACPLIPD